MDLQLKRQEEVKLIIDNVDNNDCYLTPVNVMLKGLTGTKTEELDVQNYDYSISISIKRNTSGERKMMLSLKLIEPAVTDPGQMSLFEPREQEVEREGLKIVKDFDVLTDEALAIKNRPAKNSKYANFKS